MHCKGSIYDTPGGRTGWLVGAFMSDVHHSDKWEISFMEVSSSSVSEEAPHLHNAREEFYVVFSGCIRMKIDYVPVELKKGDYLFIKKGSVSSFISADDETGVLVIEAPLDERYSP